MVKDDSLFSSLDIVSKKKIYVENDFSLDFVGHGDIPCLHGHIVDVYHVPSLSEDLLSIYELTHNGNILEF